MSKRLQLAGVGMTGLLAGNELGTLIGSHPALRTLPPPVEIEAEQAITRHLGRIMPLYMTGTLATAVAAARDRRGERGARRVAAGVAASAAMLALRLVGNVPLNKRRWSIGATAKATARTGRRSVVAGSGSMRRACCST